MTYNRFKILAEEEEEDHETRLISDYCQGTASRILRESANHQETDFHVWWTFG